jgi:S1-C subfamily serine protease
MQSRKPSFRALAAMGATLILAGMACNLGGAANATATTAPPPTSAPPVDSGPPPMRGDTGDLAMATVQILAMVDQGTEWGVVWSGSGSIISPDGLVLTNAHVVDDRFGDYDVLGVALTDRTDAPPQLEYLGEIAAVDYTLDLAVVRIVSDVDGNPLNRSLPFVSLGDSERVEIGDRLRILGYPGIGGDTITFTEGAVSGFTTERGVDGRAWIKTDATIAGGNSGGMGANEVGELVAIPTSLGAGSSDAEFADCRQLVDTNRDGTIDTLDSCVPLGGFINALRPANLARPLIDAAQEGVEYVVGAEPQASPSGGFDLSGTSFTNLVFSDGVTDDNQPTQLWYSLPSGVTDVCTFWDYEGMADGMVWSAYWFVNDELSEGGSTIAQVWDGGPSGSWWACIFNDAGLEDGLFEVVLEVEGEVLSTDAIYVGGARSLVTFELANNSSQTVCYVHLSPTEAQNWGQDELGAEEVIAAGESRTIEVASGIYDVLLRDCDGETLLEEYGIDVSEDIVYTVSD